jgi:hypothetical protein
MSFTQFANLSLATLWSATLVILLIVFAWITSPDLVNKVDQYFRHIYLYDQVDRYHLILEKYEQTNDHAEITTDLINLLVDLEEIQKVDELESTKRTAFAQLTRALLRQGQFTLAIQWVDQWLVFDPKDIEALLARARILYLDPTTRADGEHQLDLIKTQFPDSLPVANGRALTFASLGELGRAFLEFAPFTPDSDHPLVTKIGETILTIDHKYEVGDPETTIATIHLSGASLALHVNLTPTDVQPVYSAKGLEPTEYGFRKKIGTVSSLNLISADKNFDMNIIIRAAPPEALEKITAPQFQNLVLDQLRQMGELTAIAQYEAYIEAI